MKDKKNVWIFQSGEPLDIDNSKHNPMRAMQLSNYLVKNNFKVKLISANFNHMFKDFRYDVRDRFIKIKINKDFDVILINSIGYKKNISLKRFIDHFHLALNLNFYLKEAGNKPDVAFIGFPPIETSIVLSSWLDKHNIPFYLDVKDLWPEYFLQNRNFFMSSIIKMFFLLHNKYLNISFKKATGICSNNEFFLEYTINKINRKKNVYDTVCYLTKEIVKKNKEDYLKKIEFDNNIFNIYFCGNVNYFTLDFNTVLKSIKLLEEKNIIFKMYVGGYGSSYKELKQEIKNLNIKNIKLLGFLDKEKNNSLIQNCDLFIIPFRNSINYSSNFSNKFIECFQNSMPILTPLTGSVAKFIELHKIGIIYKEKNEEDLADKILSLIENEQLLFNIKQSCLKLSKTDKFNHEKNYLKIVNNLNSMILHK